MANNEKKLISQWSKRLEPIAAWPMAIIMLMFFSTELMMRFRMLIFASTQPLMLFLVKKIDQPE